MLGWQGASQGSCYPRSLATKALGEAQDCMHEQGGCQRLGCSAGACAILALLCCAAFVLSCCQLGIHPCHPLL